MNIVLFGATSAIAQAVARLYAAEKACFFLVARDTEKVQQVKTDLLVRGASGVETAVADLADVTSHALLMERLSAWGTADIALLAWGTLPDQTALQNDPAATLAAFHTNGSSVIALLSALAAQMLPAKSGTIAVITSVAGERGRYSNYLYGAAKGAVSTYAAGLRARLYHQGIHVVDIRPGFVDTPMTASFPKGPLWASPDAVAVGIKKAIAAKKNVAYVPWFWWGIMKIITHLPETISKRLKY